MSGGYNGKTVQVRLVCEECGNETFIWRRACKLKEPRHVKHLWCFECKGRTAHVEARDGS